MAFVKLDVGILDSTLWVNREPREVFITALLMAVPREFTAPVPQLRVRSIEGTGFVVPPEWYGFIPASGSGIVRRAGLAPDAGLDALEALGEPDPESRSKAHEGRRLVRVDGGYLVLNFMTYRDRDDTGAERAKRYRERKKAKLVTQNVTHRHSDESLITRDSSLAEAEAEAEEEKEISKLSLASLRPPDDDPPLAAANSNLNGTEHPKINGKAHPKAAPPDCPHIEVLALWAEMLPQLPQHDPAQWRGARADHLRARWRETAVAKHWADKAQGVEYFRRLFGYVGKSPFLTGNVKPREPGQRPFLVELEWLVIPGNWAKTIEGKYHPEEHTA